jgi:hypothetical protein
MKAIANVFAVNQEDFPRDDVNYIMDQADLGLRRGSASMAEGGFIATEVVVSHNLRVLGNDFFTSFDKVRQTAYEVFIRYDHLTKKVERVRQEPSVQWVNAHCEHLGLRIATAQSLEAAGRARAMESRSMLISRGTSALSHHFILFCKGSLTRRRSMAESISGLFVACLNGQ